MAVLRIPDENLTIVAPQLVALHLAEVGIEYERWKPSHSVAAEAPAEEILEAYHEEIATLKRRGGYVTADVIDVKPETPGLDVMLAKFSCEHWHDEDEVRFVITGRGVFHFHSQQGRVLALEVEPGDLIRVPRGTWHWFDLCAERRIRVIRLFQDPTGWTPQYTESGVDQNYQPACFGAVYLKQTASAN
jgi:1,2-dihydroxy-3-keto-5-methylthiopentene dioxygenase